MEVENHHLASKMKNFSKGSNILLQDYCVTYGCQNIDSNLLKGEKWEEKRAG